MNASPRLVTVDEFSIGQRLDNYLFKKLKGVPRPHIYRIIRKGEVRVNKGRKKAEYKLQLNDVVRIPPIKLAAEKSIKYSTNFIDLLSKSVLYEDEGLMIINKQNGVAVHGGSGVNVGVIEALKINIINQLS
jgi:23S rRNA pseudouridine955/2504/2580 synthase